MTDAAVVGWSAGFVLRRCDSVGFRCDLVTTTSSESWSRGEPPERKALIGKRSLASAHWQAFIG